MADQWYYAQQGQRQGPVSAQQLKQLASSGQLKPTDQVWKQGMAEWQPASKVQGLFLLPPVRATAVPAPLASEVLPPPVPTANMKGAVVRNVIQSPLTLIAVTLDMKRGHHWDMKRGHH
jgi:hypothetical protein